MSEFLDAGRKNFEKHQIQNKIHLGKVFEVFIHLDNPKSLTLDDIHSSIDTTFPWFLWPKTLSPIKYQLTHEYLDTSATNAPLGLPYSCKYSSISIAGEYYHLSHTDGVNTLTLTNFYTDIVTAYRNAAILKTVFQSQNGCSISFRWSNLSGGYMIGVNNLPAQIVTYSNTALSNYSAVLDQMVHTAIDLQLKCKIDPIARTTKDEIISCMHMIPSTTDILKHLK